MYVTTVRRLAPPEQGGGVLVIDEKSGETLFSADVAPTDPPIDDPANPRGGIRGARGIVRLDENRILLASFHSLLEYTNDLELIASYTHPLMAGIHAIQRDGDIIWITCTAIDLLLGYNLATRTCDHIYDVTTLKSVQDGLGIKPRNLDLSRDYRTDPSVVRGDSTHMNSVLKVGDRLLVLLNRCGAIVDVNSDELLVESRLLRGAHDITLIPERNQIAVNDTSWQSLLLFDLDSFTLVDRLRITSLRGAPFWMKKKKAALYAQKINAKLFKKKISALPLFMRGLDYKDGVVYCGTSPAAVIGIDLETRSVVSQYRISHDTFDTVYGVLGT